MVDSFSKLRMEYNSIRSVIKSYTSGSIICYLDGLKDAIDNVKKDDLLYYLEKIIKWYNENIHEIQSNEYVFDSKQREHLDNKKFLEEVYEELKNYDFSCVERSQRVGLVRNGEKKIFLSHRSSDKKYADALERLIVGLGVNNNQLIYTSHPLHKIPLGQKIYDYLRENINDQVFMIILWFRGGFWLGFKLNIEDIAALVRIRYGFSFGNPKYHEVPIDTTKMGAVLNGDANCKASMIEFKNKIQDFFELEDDEQKTAYLIDEFLENIK